MSFPAENDVETAIDNLLLVADEDPTHPLARKLRLLILEVATMIEVVEPTTYADFYSEGAWSDRAS